MNEFRIKGNLSTNVYFTPDEEENRQRSWFTVAVNRRGENKGADFIPCTVFGKTAKACAEHLYKGKEVTISGRISTYRPELEDGSIGNTILQLIARPGGVEFGRDPKGKGKGGIEDVGAIVAQTTAAILKGLAEKGLLKDSPAKAADALVEDSASHEEEENADDDCPFV